MIAMSTGHSRFIHNSIMLTKFTGLLLTTPFYDKVLLDTKSKGLYHKPVSSLVDLTYCSIYMVKELGLDLYKHCPSHLIDKAFSYKEGIEIWSVFSVICSEITQVRTLEWYNVQDILDGNMVAPELTLNSLEQAIACLGN